ncbi:MAG: PAS domain S-box protein [Syntrophobacteraceae bacterium]
MIDRRSTKEELKIRTLRGSVLGVVLYFSILVVCLLPIPSHAQTQPQVSPAANPKRILVLYSYGYSLPSYRKFNPGFVSVMEKAGVRYGDLFFEYLDLPHIGDTERKQALADILRHKYAEISLDLIITIHAPATLFLRNEAKDIFPHVPTISWIMQEGFKQDYAGNGHLQIFAGLDVQGTLKRALELFPETRRVLFISGTFQIDAETEREARSIFSHWEGELQFEYTSHLSVEETLVRVANLPPQSIVIYWNVIMDKTGRTFTPTDVGRMVAMTANAPVFCLYDTLLGLGMVGGSLQSYELGGTRTGNLALDILSGRINLTEQNQQLVFNSVPMFDWKQLERWGADTSRLPKGSIFVNRPRSVWYDYRWSVISFLVVLLVQSSLIIGLLIHRSRRKSAEELLKKAEEKYRNIYEGAIEGIYETSPEGKYLISNPALAKILGYDSPEDLTATITDSAHQVWVDPNQRLDYMRLLEQNDVVLNYECEFYRKDKTKIWVSINSRRIFGPDGETLHYSGFIEDISERKRAEETLKESETKFRSYVESAPLAIFVADREGRLIDFNPAATDLLGYDTGILRNMHILDLHPEDEREKVLRKFATLLKSGHLETEIRVKKCDGQIIWVSLHVVIISDRLSLGYCQDITERKKVEDALKQSEERYRALVETSADWIWEVDANAKYTYADPKVQKILGYTPEEVIGRTPFELMPEEEAHRIEAAFAEISADRRQFSGLINVNLHRDGREVVLETSGVPFYGPNGVFLGYRGMDRDVTERKHAEEILRESEEKFRQLAENIREVFWIRERSGFVYISPACEQIFGLNNGSLIKNPDLFIDIVHPQDKERVLNAHQKGFANREIAVDYRIIRPDGSIRWIHSRSFPVRLGEDHVRIVGIAEDITERKQMEELLQSRLSEIEDLKDRLEAESAYLQEEIKLEHNFGNIIGRSDAMQYVFYRAQQVSGTDTTVLILGETGTGKELIARTIHENSPRRARPMVKVNCAVLPAGLIESELFGHEKGAFTGAVARKLGRFELANNTTLFLDEIGELPFDLQAKLLRVIEDGEFERLGGTQTIKVNPRIIAATNRNLEKEMKEGRFRADLWYRLNVYPVTLPPLRERTVDIPLMIVHFVEKYSKQLGKTIQKIPAGLVEALENYKWPGNVRELQHIIERAVINSLETTLQLADDLGGATIPQAPAMARDKSLEELEREYILEILAKTGWKIEGRTGAAEILNLNPGTLRSRMKKLGIQKAQSNGAYFH